MRVRPVDKNGDMMPIQDNSQFIEGAYAIAQVVKERLLFYKGEWWENPEMGIMIPDFLAESMRKNDIDMLVKYLTGYIAETRGVNGVVNVVAEYENRSILYRATLQTMRGDAELEVELNGLL